MLKAKVEFWGETSLKKLILIILLSTLQIKALNSKEKLAHDNYVSVGFLDHKMGLSLFSFGGNFYNDENSEIYLGIGSMLTINTLAAGYKYTIKGKYIDFYAVGAMHFMVGMSDHIIIAPFASLGFEDEGFKNLFFNIGYNALLRFYAPSSSMKPEILALPVPNVAVSYRY